MKKLILLSILLIVGCAPTKPPTATFYIGMLESEFVSINPTIKKKDREVSFEPVNPAGVSTVKVYYEGGISKYYYGFNGDTLRAVWHGLANVVKNQQIDYSKYPNSKPE